MMKLIKLSTCLICLGTLISGLSATAMEDNNGHIEKTQATKESNNSRTDQDKTLGSIYGQETAKGRRTTYARRYASLLANFTLPEDLSRKDAAGLVGEEAIEEAIMASRSKESSKATNVLPVLEEIEEVSKKSSPEQEPDNETCEELKKKEPKLIDLDSEIDPEVSDESIRISFKGSEEIKYRKRVLYDKKRKEGKSKLYSLEYVRQCFEMKDSSNRSRDARKIAGLFEKYVLEERLSQQEARKKALEGSRGVWVRRKLLEQVDGSVLSEESIKKLDGGKKNKVSIYMKKKIDGKSDIYAQEYIRQYYKLSGMNTTYRRLIADELAEKYEEYVLHGYSPEKARKKALEDSPKAREKIEKLKGTKEAEENTLSSSESELDFEAELKETKENLSEPEQGQELEDESASEPDSDSDIDEEASDKDIKNNFKGDEKVKKKMMQLYDRQRKKGKSKLYSVEYVRRFFSKGSQSNKCKYANKLASLFESYILTGMPQKEARRKAWKDHCMGGLKEKRVNLISGQELEQERRKKAEESESLLRLTLKLDLDSEIDKDASDESIKESLKENKELGRKMVSLYDKQRKIGNSKLYSVEYVKQYYRMIRSGNRSAYAKELANLFEEYASKGLPQREARRKALAVFNERHKALEEKLKRIGEESLESKLEQELDSEPAKKKKRSEVSSEVESKIDLNSYSSEESETTTEDEKD